MTVPIAIFGAGGHAREVLQIILDINENFALHPIWEPVGFVVDESYADKSFLHGVPVYEASRWLGAHRSTAVIIAIGCSKTRRRISKRISGEFGNPFASLVHPKAWIGRNVIIGEGSIICAGSMVTTDVRIGRHVHINVGTTISHDSLIGDFSTLGPGVNVPGNVTIGEGVQVGVRGTFIPHTCVGSWSIIGAGAVITKSFDENITAVGVPAKVIRVRVSGWHEEDSS